MSWLYDTVKVEKWRVSLRKVISKHLLDADVEMVAGFVSGVEADITGYLWAEQLQHVEIKYPATWQDAWKEEHLQNMPIGDAASYKRQSLKSWLLWQRWWASRWLLKRWPIQYKTHVVDVKAVFPELRLAMSEEPYVIHYTETYG